MEPKVYINGKLYAKEEAKISVFDHGLLYGDGVFEGIRSYNGNVFKLEEHIQRLFNSARAIALAMPMTQTECCEAVLATLKANNLTDAYIRVVVTRGIGTLGLNPYLCEQPQVIIITDNVELYSKELYEKGLEIVSVATVRNLRNAINPRIKSLNYLNNILAKIEAIQGGAAEGILLNAEGYVAECTGDNIFIMRGGKLLTPPVHAGILEGITRNTVIDLGREAGITVEERMLTRYDLYSSEECFLTGTAAEVVPVVKIDRRVIGNGVPGPVTLKLLDAFKRLINGASRT